MAGKESSTRVWANGCFDVFHFGHANFLRQAKNMGDYLIAGVHGDEDIAKNKGNPVIGEEERGRIISAVKWVDEVQHNIPYGDVLEILDENECDFCVHGDDIATDASGRDIYAQSKENGRFKECKRTAGISTTLIIDRILFNAGGQCESVPPHAENGHKKRVPEMSHEYYNEKINAFSSNISREPREGCKVGYAQGVFDLFHAGHVAFLEKCKRNADDVFLVVGVLNDDEAFGYFGGYPVTNTYERALALMSCKFVDRVKIGVPFKVTADFLDHLQVDYVFHGQKWELPSDPYLAAKDKNIFIQLDSGSDTTTNTIIQRVIDKKEMYNERNSKKTESLLSKMVSKMSDV